MRRITSILRPARLLPCATAQQPLPLSDRQRFLLIDFGYQSKRKNFLSYTSVPELVEGKKKSPPTLTFVLIHGCRPNKDEGVEMPSSIPFDKLIVHQN